MDEPDDTALLTAWRDGDREAGGRLFDRHFAAVFRFFATKVGDVAAQDLAQRTFLAVVEGRDRIRDGLRVRAYVLGVARNQLLMALRSRARKPEAPLEHSCVDELAPSPVSALVESQEERAIVRALRRIPLELQSVIELHYWEQLSTEELAAVLGTSREAIKSRLFRARQQVRRALAEIATEDRLPDSSVANFEEWLERLRATRA